MLVRRQESQVDHTYRLDSQMVTIKVFMKSLSMILILMVAHLGTVGLSSAAKCAPGSSEGDMAM